MNGILKALYVASLAQMDSFCLVMSILPLVFLMELGLENDNFITLSAVQVE